MTKNVQQYLNGVDQALINEIEQEGDLAVAEALALIIGTVHEIEHGGPLVSYIAKVRTSAIEAIRALPALDPRDVAGVIEIQTRVRLYEGAIKFMVETLQEAHHLAAEVDDAPDDETPEFGVDEGAGDGESQGE